MTHIFYFSRGYTPHDYRFLEALSRTEYKVDYLRLENRQPSLEHRPLPENIRQIKWTGGQGPLNFEDLSGLVGDLERVIQEVQPDLIHAGPIQSAAYLAARTGFKPLVSMSWGYDLLVDADRSPELRQATSFTLQHSTVLVGDCQAVRQKAISLGMPPEQIVTFPWGVDLEDFSLRRAPAPDKNAFTIFSTRSWEALYGVDILAQAFVQASRQNPELRLCMLGNGSLATELQSIFEKGGLIERVSFPGQVQQSNLPEYYRSADLYVSASHTDGSSISLLEALACGVPALVSDIPGNREWVEPGVQGWLFPEWDVEALAQGILHAVRERQALPEMGRAARQLAEARADWSKNFTELLRAYELALACTSEPDHTRET
ncbi:MAG TPA: glycosyltransferase family 4 protein [Anaerolineales bacterium]|nr:glycosyltransferase family 4 protein [Anaerolineales bacterium]